jgi:hypothetical protein
MIFSKEKLEKLRKREAERISQQYYSKESIWHRHQQNVKNDRERAKKQGDLRIESSAMNNDWD